MNKILLSTSLIALLATSACSSFKPDHPQVYKSFADRFMPNENLMAARGEFASEEVKAKKIETPYAPGLAINKEAKPPVNNIFKEPAPRKSDTLLGRIKNLFSNEEEGAVAVSQNKRSLDEGIAEKSFDDGQGDNIGYTYYDMSEELPGVKYKNLQFISFNDVSAIPSGSAAPLLDMPPPQITAPVIQEPAPHLIPPQNQIAPAPHNIQDAMPQPPMPENPSQNFEAAMESSKPVLIDSHSQNAQPAIPLQMPKNEDIKDKKAMVSERILEEVPAQMPAIAPIESAKTSASPAKKPSKSKPKPKPKAAPKQPAEKPFYSSSDVNDEEAQIMLDKYGNLKVSGSLESKLEKRGD